MMNLVDEEHADGSVKLIFRACRRAILGVAAFSLFINVLSLTGTFFMIEVYDRVIPSRSVPTLMGLGLITLFLYALHVFTDIMRARLLARIGAYFGEALESKIFGITLHGSLKTRSAFGLLPIRDLDQVRSFIAGPALTTVFDLPWAPLFLFICFVFSTLIGCVALAGIVVLLILAVLTEVTTRTPNREAVEAAEKRMVLAEMLRRNAQLIYALGMAPSLAGRWQSANRGYLETQRNVSDVTSGLSSIARGTRLFLQSGVLATGAILVIEQKASGGIMMASSVLMARTLAPIELAIAQWNNFLSARRAWRRVAALLARIPVTDATVELPAPSSSLALSNITVKAPGTDQAIISAVSFELRAGEALGVIGASGSGKSTLARVIAGLWQPSTGELRIDGATIDQWGALQFGRHVGYLPQEPELLNGSIAENISRFDPSVSDEKIIAAATAAGVHELVLRFPAGYATQVGEGGGRLSAGQRQRIALARALYNDPFLLVLDEPNSNLDPEGEQALSKSVLQARVRGAIVVVIAHRPSVLVHVGRVLVMSDGRVDRIDDKDAILGHLKRPPVPVVNPNYRQTVVSKTQAL